MLVSISLIGLASVKVCLESANGFHPRMVSLSLTFLGDELSRDGLA